MPAGRWLTICAVITLVFSLNCSAWAQDSSEPENSAADTAQIDSENSSAGEEVAAEPEGDPPQTDEYLASGEAAAGA